MNEQEIQNDLDLKALDYTQGLMDASSVETFERTLAQSQDARDAVVRAVLLLEASPSLASTSEQPVVGRIHPWIAAVAAALVAAAGVSLVMPSADNPPSHAATDKPVPAPAIDADSRLELVTAWMDLETNEEDTLELDELASAPIDDAETLDWLNEALQSREN